MALLVAVWCVVLGASPVPAAGVQSIDLRSDWDLRIRGSGYVGEVGDVNDDGKADVLVNGRRRVWVVFGRSRGGTIDTASLDDDAGFLIYGRTGLHSAPAGDVNGDGADDILVGVPDAKVRGMAGAGIVYVIFGNSSQSVDLRIFDAGEQGGAGYRILGGSVFAQTGQMATSLGDLNQDGLADVAVAAPFASTTYVVFGQQSTDTVDLAAWDDNMQGGRGFRISTRAPASNEFYSVAGVGDTNGDLTPDLLVGVVTGENHPGSAYLVFGKADPLPVDTTIPGGWGFRIKGDRQGDFTGFDNSLAGAGDVNGDGLGDVIVGASRIYENEGRGRAAVVFGKPTIEDVALSDLGSNGFWIKGHWQDATGSDVAAMGDVNLDGLDDVAVGAFRSDHNSRPDSGSAYVVYGKRDTSSIDLRERAEWGYRIDGPWREGHFAAPLASLGDVNQDGVTDLAIGSYGRDVAFLVWHQP